MDPSNRLFEPCFKRQLAVRKFSSRHFINAEGQKLRKDELPSEVYPSLLVVQRRQAKRKSAKQRKFQVFGGEGWGRRRNGLEAKGGSVGIDGEDSLVFEKRFDCPSAKQKLVKLFLALIKKFLRHGFLR